MTIRYGVRFGYGDSSDMYEWDCVGLDGEQWEAAREAYEDGMDLSDLSKGDIEELDPLFQEAYEAIRAEQEIELSDDDFAQECLHGSRYTAEDVNERVRNRDARTLAYFHLENATEAELESWDAHALDPDGLPREEDLDPDFVSQSPFDCGWDLIVTGYIDESEFEDEDDEDYDDEDDEDDEDEDDDDGEEDDDD